MDHEMFADVTVYDYESARRKLADHEHDCPFARRDEHCARCHSLYQSAEDAYARMKEASRSRDHR